MPDTQAPTEDTPTTGNHRVDRLLATARQHGYVITRSTNVRECWTIKAEPDTGYSLTVYAEPNQAAVVMADLPGSGEWETITQRRAIALLTDGGLQ